QHQRRHVEPAVEHVTNPRLAANGNTLGKQSRDVAIDGAFRRLEFSRHCIRRHRLFRAAEDLDDFEKSVGLAHEFLSTGRLLPPSCQQASGRYVASGSATQDRAPRDAGKANKMKGLIVTILLATLELGAVFANGGSSLMADEPAQIPAIRKEEAGIQ